MKKKITILVLLFLLCLLFCYVPYKFYRLIFCGGASESYAILAEDISSITDGNWLSIAFMFIFFPVVLVAEILFFADISSGKRKILFVVQGLLGLLATYIMHGWMTFYMLETNVKLTSMFYLSLIFVGISSIGSILLAVPKINILIKK